MGPLDDLSRAELIVIIVELRQRVVALEAEVARLRKNSSNSSKPPSSDPGAPGSSRPSPCLPVDASGGSAVSRAIPATSDRRFRRSRSTRSARTGWIAARIVEAGLSGLTTRRA